MTAQAAGLILLCVVLATAAYVVGRHDRRNDRHERWLRHRTDREDIRAELDAKIREEVADEMDALRARLTECQEVGDGPGGVAFAAALGRVLRVADDLADHDDLITAHLVADRIRRAADPPEVPADG